MQLKRQHHGDEIKFLNKNIKYNFSVNINPLGLPDCVVKALSRAQQVFSDYPDTECVSLRRAIAGREGVGEQHIVCGNGASDLIYRVCASAGINRALIPVPAFSEYGRALSINGLEAEYLYTEAADDFALTCEAFEKWIAGTAGRSPENLPDAVFLCNPANPSGRLMTCEALDAAARWCREHGAMLIVDECFLDFHPDAAALTAVNTIRKALSGGAYAPDIIVIKAFTKIYAMAGLRLGYAVCSRPEAAASIAAFGPPWSVSGPAQTAGLAALSDRDYLRRTVELIGAERRRLSDFLKNYFVVYKSDANYILFKGPEGLAGAMAEQGIAIRSCGDYAGLDDSFFRVAVRTEKENDMLMEALGRCCTNWL